MEAKRATKKQSPKRKKQGAKIIQLNIFQQPHQRSVQKLIDGLWVVVATFLWFNKTFTESETESHKALIGEYFFNGKDSKRNFKELIERICLAKRYVARRRGRYISKPQDYLNIHYPMGLAGTQSWLEQVNEIRKDVPDYNKGISTLAKALLAFIENSNAANFHKGRRSLIEQDQFDLLQMYNNTILHLQYKL